MQTGAQTSPQTIHLKQVYKCICGHCCVQEVIFQTREKVFDRDIHTPRGELKIRRETNIICDEIRGVWIGDETLSRMFDISSQSKQKLQSKQRSKNC